MEITFSKSQMRRAAAVILIIAAFVFAYQKISTDSAFRSKLISLLPFGTSEISMDEYNNQPALKALVTIYSPSGTQSAWEQQVCSNMTQSGCDLFNFYYSPTIWKSGVSGTNTQFVEVMETLEDKSQIWLAGTTINGTTQPLFIHVEKRADGNWVLARILFEEEAKKYEK